MTKYAVWDWNFKGNWNSRISWE